MKKNLISRILGALSSALIIISVFVPFISAKSFSMNLWDMFKMADALYLPIMIIVFGAIGVIFFSLNVKTEFAYMSTGAITFFIIMRTIDIIDQKTFNTLGVGYYLLAIGAILTGVMAFVNNLKTKKKEENVVQNVQTIEPSMIDQIDKLYNEQTTSQSEVIPIQPVDNVVQPIPVQPIESIQPLTQMEPIQTDLTINNQVSDIQSPSVQPQTNQQVMENSIDQPQIQVPQNNQITPNPVLQEFEVPSIVTPIEEPVTIQQQPSVSVNPVLQEFEVPIMNNSVQPVEQSVDTTVNPVLQEFNQPQTSISTFNISEPVQPTQVVEQPVVESTATTPLSDINNPVLQQFSNPGSTVSNTNNSDSLDIFGQPLN